MCEPVSITLLSGLAGAFGASAATGGAVMSLAGLGGGLLGASAGLSAYGAYQQSRANQERAKYDAAVAENNAKLAEFEAEDALSRGAAAAGRKHAEYAQLRGKQVATMAASGLDFASGTGLALLDDAAYMEAVDVTNVRNASRREAWGARVQRNNYRSAAAMNRAAAAAENPLGAAATSLLTSGASVASRWLN